MSISLISQNWSWYSAPLLTAAENAQATYSKEQLIFRAYLWKSAKLHILTGRPRDFSPGSLKPCSTTTHFPASPASGVSRQLQKFTFGHKAIGIWMSLHLRPSLKIIGSEVQKNLSYQSQLKTDSCLFTGEHYLSIATWPARYTDSRLKQSERLLDCTALSPDSKAAGS